MDEPAIVAWKYAANLICWEDLRMSAAHLSAAGHDSPSLCDLAGRSRREHPAEIRRLFGQTMEELGVQIPDYETGERCLLHHMATQLSASAMSPKEAAVRVWRGIEALTDPEREFVAAVGLEYHLDFMSSEEARAWENAVRLAAKTLAGTASHTRSDSSQGHAHHSPAAGLRTKRNDVYRPVRRSNQDFSNADSGGSGTGPMTL